MQIRGLYTLYEPDKFPLSSVPIIYLSPLEQWPYFKWLHWHFIRALLSWQINSQQRKVRRAPLPQSCREAQDTAPIILQPFAASIPSTPRMACIFRKGSEIRPTTSKFKAFSYFMGSKTSGWPITENLIPTFYFNCLCNCMAILCLF